MYASVSRAAPSAIVLPSMRLRATAGITKLPRKQRRMFCHSKLISRLRQYLADFLSGFIALGPPLRRIDTEKPHRGVTDTGAWGTCAINMQTCFDPPAGSPGSKDGDSIQRMNSCPCAIGGCIDQHVIQQRAIPFFDFRKGFHEGPPTFHGAPGKPRGVRLIAQDRIDAFLMRAGMVRLLIARLDGIGLCRRIGHIEHAGLCLLYTSPSPRDRQKSRMPSSA